MNIVTKSDTKKFIALLKAGLKEGTRKEMRNYSSASNYDGTDVPKSYYVSLEFSFNIAPEAIEHIISDDLLNNEIDDLLSDE